MRIGHFFAGGGGGILASEILGHESVFALEVDERRCEILKQRATEGWFPHLHVECCDIRSFDPTPWTGKLDCIAAGFPCQDISAAGRGEGLRGEKSGLVWHLLEAVRFIRPGLVFLENSPFIRTRGRIPILQWLLENGYSYRDGTLAAAHVGAPHLRNRWWCLAVNSDGMRKLEQERVEREKWGWDWNELAEVANLMCIRSQGQGTKEYSQKEFSSRQTQNCGPTFGNETPAHTFRHRLQSAIQQGGLSETDAEAIQAAAGYCNAYHWTPPDIGVCRVVDGMADRIHRIATCGDGQVPLQAAVAWRLLEGESLGKLGEL